MSTIVVFPPFLHYQIRQSLQKRAPLGIFVPAISLVSCISFIDQSQAVAGPLPLPCRILRTLRWLLILQCGASVSINRIPLPYDRPKASMRSFLRISHVWPAAEKRR